MTRLALSVAGAIVCLAWAILTAWAFVRGRRLSPWADALSDPATRRAPDEGLADLVAGRVQPWDPYTTSLTANPAGNDVSVKLFGWRG